MNAVPDFPLMVSAGMSALGSLPMPAASGSPDGDLLRACAEFIGLERWVRGVYDDPDAEQFGAAEASVCEAETRISVLVDQMDPLRATTLEGLHARALALATHNSDFGFSFDDPSSIAGLLLSMLLRDAAHMTGDSTDAKPGLTWARTI